MTENSHVLWIGEHHMPPPNVRHAIGERWFLRMANSDEPLDSQLRDVSLALVWPNGTAEDPARLSALLSGLEQSSAVSVFLLPQGARAAKKAIDERQSHVLWVDQDLSAAELSAQLAAAAALRPVIVALRKELGIARDANAGSTEMLQQLDEEMRLAARLQRDFLPRRLPEVGTARFGVLYRPVTWVSGDIYDVTRLDESHVGFYVADVVGHGMPAALLTMFIKKALQTKRIVGSTYQIVPPEMSLAELNTDICEQNLSSCQFCTAVYGVLDTSTRILTYARGGHPEPLLFRRDGTVTQLAAKGSLLGIFPDEQFESCQVQLEQGDRVIFFTDGAEEALRPPGQERGTPLEKLIGRLSLHPRDELLVNLVQRMEAYQGNGQAEDDVTVLVLDVE